MKNSKVAAMAAGSAIVLLGVGACSAPTGSAGPGSPGEESPAEQAAFDEIADLSGDQRTQTLVEKAQAEGTLSLYTSNVSMEDLIGMFEDMYDISVDVYLGTSESVLQRVQQEADANYNGSDILEGNGDALDILAGGGLFADYETPARDDLPDVAQSDGWTGSRYAVYAPAWNTDMVAPEDEPGSFEDLADPKYAGMLSVELGDYDWYYTVKQHFLDSGMSEDEVAEVFTGIVRNATIAKGHTQQAQFLSAGEFAICVACYTDAIDRAADNGAPVTWNRSDNGLAVEPLVVRTSGTAVMRTAQHPYAAMLFQDFMLSPEAQAYLTQEYRIGTVPQENDPLADYEPLPMYPEVIRENAAEAQAEYDELLRGAAGGA